MGIIYKITSPANRIYIGQTFDMRTRINSHRYSQKLNKPHVILINSFRKYGFDNHLFEIIEECDDKILDEREIFWMNHYQSFYGFNKGGMNMTLGGYGNSWRVDNFSDERRRTININNLLVDGKNPFLGKKHTEMTKKILSEKASIRNKEKGYKVPYWGAEKGWAKSRKKIIAYDENGCFLKIYISLSEASKDLNINHSCISDSLKYGLWNFGKYKFIYYKDDNYPLKISTDDKRVKNEKRPILYLDKEYKIIKEYPSGVEAAEDLNLPKTTINRASMYNNLRPIRKGHIFVYKDLYESSISRLGEGIK